MNDQGKSNGQAAFGSGTKPFAGFTEASRAVFATLAETEPRTASELLVRLLATLMAAEARADEAGMRAEQAEADSLIDPLTGLANRRAWQRAIVVEEDRCKRFGIPASVAIIDLDDLKVINDNDGHQAGDECLRRTARVILNQTRAHDFVARLGGDEFGVLAINCDHTDASVLGVRLSQALRVESIGASLGLASRGEAEHDLQAVWDRADGAMYKAKRGKKSDLMTDEDRVPNS